MQEIAKDWPQCRAAVETAGVATPSFDIAHESDGARDAYEVETCLGGKETQISDLVQTLEVPNINDAATAQLIREWAPDITIDFGTRKVSAEIIDLNPERIVNLHGGDPEEYRGLDSHMWAMYHDDFSNLVTTLHTLAPELDDGGIIETMPIPLFKGMKIHQFRRYNTEVCIKMVSNLLKSLEKGGEISARSQKEKGRYYSFMPTDLKNIAARKFEKYTAQLDG